METEKFDLVLVTEKFKGASEFEDDILMDFYLQAFREILKYVFGVNFNEFNLIRKNLSGSFISWAQFSALYAQTSNQKSKF